MITNRMLTIVSSELSQWLGGKVSTSRAEYPGINSHFAGDLQIEPLFLQSSHTIDLKICTLGAALPGAWHNMVSARTGWPGISVPSSQDFLISNLCDGMYKQIHS